MNNEPTKQTPPLDKLVEEAVKEFDERFDSSKYGSWVIPIQKAREEIKSFLSSKVQEVALKFAEGCVPEEATEADGWSIVSKEHRCCPGDDASEGFNSARQQMFTNIKSNVDEI